MSMEESETLPLIVFDTQGFESEEAYWQWQQNMAPLFDAQVDAESRHCFSASAEVYLAEHCVVSTSQYSEQTFERDRYWSEQYDPEHLVVQLYFRGGFSGLSAGKGITVKPGDIAVLDLRYHLKTRDQTSDMICIVIPRSVYQSYNGKQADLTSMVIPAKHPLAHQIADLLKRLWSELPVLHAELANNLLNQNLERLLDYLTMAQRQIRGTQKSHKQQKKEQILALIEANLSSDNLSVTTLASASHVSRSTIYRLFEEDGGLAGYIQKRRLEKCYRLIEQGYSGKLTDIATDWGFTDHSHFSARFKKIFSMTPSELRRQATQVLGQQGVIAGADSCTEVQDWLLSL
ncbi:helix-turn-helix domain-containing protein [Bacterioplanoides sp.]|uniref:helix-turn-helix domain-containing protein n=1 Tax=Bacterioplanoides sp. TaxID=2066072 RepID=UPI003B0074C8